MTSNNDIQICGTCAVENTSGRDVCAICSDARQYVPKSGQHWTSLEQMRKGGYRVEMIALEPDLYGITSVPAAGIGQQTKLLCTPHGNLLWDPIGYVDAAAVSRVRELGDVRAIVASHPHMYGVQVAWSHALGNVPVLGYPNRLPLSGAVVARIAASVNRFSFDRLYGNFDTVIECDAKRVIQESADRHTAWISGEFDELT